MQSGVSIFDVQAMLRHRNIATTQQYAHHDPGAHAGIKKAWTDRAKTEQRRDRTADS
jgi:site-specific recombinase XerD